MVPVAREKATLLKTALLATADKYNIELTILSAEQQVWQIIGENSPYFLIELPDATRFYTRQMASFPLHFGREVSMPSSALISVSALVRGGWAHHAQAA